MTKIVLRDSFLELQRFTKLYASKYFLLAVLVFGLIILLLPNLLRDNPFMIGEESFDHLKNAKNILENKETKFFGNGLSYIIAGSSFITRLSVENSSRLLFLIIGLVSLFFIYLIFKLLDLKEGLLGIPILIISPAFIYLFTVVNKFAVPMLLMLLIIHFLLKKRFYISGICFLLLPIFDYSFTLFILIMGILYLLYNRKNKFILLFILLVLLIWLLTFSGFNFDLISDFGGDLGLSVFGIFIVLLGLGFFWRKKKFIQLYALTFFLFLIYLKLDWLVFILNIPFCLLIAFSLLSLLKMKWENGLIRDLTILILICGLLFSGVSFVKSLSGEEPSEEFFDALGLIPRDSVVLSYGDNNYWISYAGLGIVDTDLADFFMTRNFDIVTGILDSNRVDYILITSDMRHGLVWEKEEEGLLFLLKYSPEFEKIHDGNVEIWKYLKK